MKRKNLSLLVGLVLTASMLLTAVPFNLGPNAYHGTVPMASSSISSIGVVTNDVLYYRFANQYDEGVDPGDAPDEGVIKVEVADVNLGDDMIYYDFYRPETNGSEWSWLWMNNDMMNDSASWLEDDFTYPTFNHTIIFPNNITDMQAQNISEGLDGLIMGAFSSSSIYSEYSDGSSAWNTVYFEVYPNDGPNMTTITLWFNKTTGIMTYYDEYSEEEGHGMTLELAGFELQNYDFVVPDSFGVGIGDYVDRFVPEHMDQGDQSSSDDWQSDDIYEQNDDNNSAFMLDGSGTVIGNLALLDDDYYKVWLEDGDSFEVEVMGPPHDEASYALEYVDPLGNNNGIWDDNFDNWTHINFIANGSMEYVFHVYGDQMHYGLRMSTNGNPVEDIFEDNDNYLNPSDIDIGGGNWHYGPLVQNDPDYYRFNLQGGWEAHISVWCSDTSTLVLSDINPYDGGVIQSDSSTGDGHLEVTISAGETGPFIIRVDGDPGMWYDLDIQINNFDNNDGGNDNSVWIRENVEFVYYNPYTDEDVLILTQTAYKSPTMDPMEKMFVKPLYVAARVNASNPNMAIGEGWFHKNIDFTSSDFANWFEANALLDWDVIDYTVDYHATWLEVWGTVNKTGEDFYFYAERLPTIGTVQFFLNSYYNASEDREQRDMSMVIDCSVSGEVKESDPHLGVSEGDSWSYLVQNQYKHHDWGDSGDNWDDQESVIMATFTVTHIFALNHTTMGVVGSMEVQEIHNDGSVDPEHHIDNFSPFLVWDTTNPVSFMTMGGLGNIEGPPVLLPSGVDWSTQETAMINMFDQMHEGPGAPIASYFDSNTVRLKFDDEFSDDWDEGDGHVYVNRTYQEQVVLDVDSHGITTHLDQSHYSREERMYYDGISGGSSSGSEESENMVAFIVDSTKGVSTEPDINSVTGLTTGNTLVWERSRYHPAGEWGPNDPGDDPADKSFDKVVIADVLSAGDNFVVFLGAQFWKGPDMTTYEPHEWHLDSEGGEVTGNIWFLGAVRKNDIWTWINNQIFDKSVTTFEGREADLAEILTFAFAPDASITAADITTDGLSFEARVSDGGIDHVFRLAVSPEGIMQDMFQGDYDTTANDWLSWERTVLVVAPSGYTIGEFFMDDIPSNYVNSSAQTNTGDDTSSDDTAGDDTGFDISSIPSYPVGIFMTSMILGLVALTLRKRH